MSERFFLSSPPRDGHAVLDGQEARHLTRVMRCRVGDEVVVFDGGGSAWPARVARIGRDDVALEVGEPVYDPERSRGRVTLAVALPKGDRQKWLVEKLTELGVDSLVPLTTNRGVAEATPAAIERLERSVIEACKQCGRNTLMRIESPRGLDDVLAHCGVDTMAFLADGSGDPFDHSLVAGRPAVVLVGPEGGFTPEERAAAEALGATRLSLGPYILRVETAAIAAAARFA